jgi:hypothetical protein
MDQTLGTTAEAPPIPPLLEVATPSETLQLPILGMTCAACVRRVEGALARWRGSRARA